MNSKEQRHDMKIINELYWETQIYEYLDVLKKYDTFHNFQYLDKWALFRAVHIPGELDKVGFTNFRCLYLRQSHKIPFITNREK